MEHKNLRKTDGVPVYFGIASGILLLLSSILSVNVSLSYMPALAASTGVAAVSNPMITYVSTIVSFVINPGIFLILLFLGKDKAKRGTAFGIVWSVISCLSIISGITSVFMKSSTSTMIKTYASQIVPGGTAVYFGLPLLGSACMLISCIVFLRRFKKPENFENQLAQ